MENKYLLHTKFKQNETIKNNIQLCNALQICNFIEYLDLDYSIIDYDIKLITISKKTNKIILSNVCFTSECYNYESGGHVLYICKGKKTKYDEFNQLLNILDNVDFTTDH